MVSAHTTCFQVPREEPLPLESSNKKTSSIPFTTSEYSGEELIFSYISDPFGFAVKKRSNGETLFNSTPEAEDPYASMVFKDQYLEISARLPKSSSSLHGLGENTQPGGIWLQPNDPYTLHTTDIFAINLNTDLYGLHPVYMDLRIGMKRLLNMQSCCLNTMGWMFSIGEVLLTYKITGGVFDFYYLSGPVPLDIIDCDFARIQCWRYKKASGRRDLHLQWPNDAHEEESVSDQGIVRSKGR